VQRVARFLADHDEDGGGIGGGQRRQRARDELRQSLAPGEAANREQYRPLA
jgi:hypothetical protein